MGSFAGLRTAFLRQENKIVDEVTTKSYETQVGISKRNTE